MNQDPKARPIQVPTDTERRVASATGRERSYIYAENASKERPPEDDQPTPEPKPDLSNPPSD